MTRARICLVLCLLPACRNEYPIKPREADTGSQPELTVSIDAPADGSAVAMAQSVSARATVSFPGEALEDVQLRWVLIDQTICTGVPDEYGSSLCTLDLTEAGELRVDASSNGWTASDTISLQLDCIEETCDGIDNDCDGEVDNNAVDAVEGFIDGDGDDYGDKPASTCTGNLASTGGDCDDTDATIHPGAAETCDGTDRDCDGSAPSLGAEECPATNCNTLLQDEPSLAGQSGTYFIDAGDAADPFEVYCDMDTEGGGWTLVVDRRRLDPCWYYPAYGPNNFPESILLSTDLVDLRSENQGLTDARWLRLRDQSSTVLVTAEEHTDTDCAADRWHTYTADIVDINQARCQTIADSLGAYVLAWDETTGCTGSGTDYTTLLGGAGNQTDLRWLTNIYSQSDTPFFEGVPDTRLWPWKAQLFVR